MTDTSVTSTLEIQVLPDPLQQSYDAVHATLAATRAFAGCLGVEVLIDDADPAHLLLVERWESIEADAAYRAWRATQGASELRNVLTGPPTLQTYRPSPL